MKMKMRHRPQPSTIAPGPCQHCGQTDHKRSCVAELGNQLVNTAEALGKALAKVAELTKERDAALVEVQAVNLGANDLRAELDQLRRERVDTVVAQ